MLLFEKSLFGEPMIALLLSSTSKKDFAIAKVEESMPLAYYRALSNFRCCETVLCRALQ